MSDSQQLKQLSTNYEPVGEKRMRRTGSLQHSYNPIVSEWTLVTLDSDCLCVNGSRKGQQL